MNICAEQFEGELFLKNPKGRHAGTQNDKWNKGTDKPISHCLFTGSCLAFDL